MQPLILRRLKKLARFSALAMGLLGGCVGEQSALDPHSPEATNVANLSWLPFGIAALVLLVVTTLLLIAIFRAHRNANTAVTWQNVGHYSRTATFDPDKNRQLASGSVPAGAQAFDSGMLYPGQTWSDRFDTAGTYLYSSQYPPGNNCLGVIAVIAS